MVITKGGKIPLFFQKKEEFMRLQNKSKRMYVHSILNERKQAVLLTLSPGENKEIPDEVALQWLKSGEVVKYADPDEVEKLKAELAELKAKKEPAIEGVKKEPSLEDLKKEADNLGISYARNIGVAKLAEKIAAAKKN